MFNIEFGNSNTAQVSLATFNTGGTYSETLYCAPHNLKQLRSFLIDVRSMPQDEWQDVIEILNEEISKI